MRLLINPRYAHLEGFVRGLHHDLFKLQGMVQRLMEMERQRMKDNCKRVLMNR
ncbi:MAG: hypothetical protein IIX20_07260 [Alistipes sp.]|nr:hypothetical protein [Alistipes sp.]